MSTKRTSTKAKAETIAKVAEVKVDTTAETKVAEAIAETKTKVAEVKAEVIGLTVKGLPETATKTYGSKLKNGKENSYYTAVIGDTKYRIAVNFDSFDSLMREDTEAVKTADIIATYKVRENGKTVRETEVHYGTEAEAFTTYRAFYDRKLTGGIDTAIVKLTDNDIILYVNRASKFREFESDDKGIRIVTKTA